jgi:(1->4)-alpha-D-glucan 1-alpha-D-glucosylmutase
MEMIQRWEDGRIKLYITARGLAIRRRYPGVFLQGEYLPLTAEGEQADHVIALARRHLGTHVLAVVPRFPASLNPPPCPPPTGGGGYEWGLPVGPASWKNTRIILPPDCDSDSFSNSLTGEKVQASRREGVPRISVADVLTTCPVALLENGKTPA